MAEVLKFGRKAQPEGEEIPAALREFVDDVIVPALVREYLAKMKPSKTLVQPTGAVSDSAPNVLVFSEVRR